ncbi:MAG: transposase family protein, partial [Angustibacter sp.]
AGIGVHIPTKGQNLAVDNRTRNRMITALRAPAERANALLKSTFRALRRITLCPRRIGAITAAALIILTMQRGRW